MRAYIYAINLLKTIRIFAAAQDLESEDLSFSPHSAPYKACGLGHVVFCLLIFTMRVVPCMEWDQEYESISTSLKGKNT